MAADHVVPVHWLQRLVLFSAQIEPLTYAISVTFASLAAVAPLRFTLPFESVVHVLP